MNKITRDLVVCFIISIFIWSIPFFVRILFMDSVLISQTKPSEKISSDIVSIITEKLNNGNKWSAFYLIFSNNLKVCIINILGGILLGIGTLISLFINGFYTADILSNIHNNGNSWSTIFDNTISHSFEMIGIWLSGGLGFLITKSIFNVMIKNKYPTLLFYKTIGITSLLITLIIFVAAFIESFISIN